MATASNTLHEDDLPDEVVDRHRVLVVPGLYIADDATLQWLARYAAAGGHLVLGPRTGYADEEARARTDVPPAHLAEPAGIWYDEYSNISAEVLIRAASASSLELEPDAAGTRWVDGLQLSGADVLAGYDHPHFGRWPAITTREHGQGRITYVGTVPNTQLATALFRWLTPRDIRAQWPRPASVTITGATARDGRRIHFVHNWSWEPVTIRTPTPVQDLLATSEHDLDQDVSLNAWDVRILAER